VSSKNKFGKCTRVGCYRFSPSIFPISFLQDFWYPDWWSPDSSTPSKLSPSCSRILNLVKLLSDPMTDGWFAQDLMVQIDIFYVLLCCTASWTWKPTAQIFFFFQSDRTDIISPPELLCISSQIWENFKFSQALTFSPFLQAPRSWFLAYAPMKMLPLLLFSFESSRDSTTSAPL